MAIIGLQKGSGKWLIFREKSGNFEMDIGQVAALQFEMACHRPR